MREEAAVRDQRNDAHRKGKARVLPRVCFIEFPTREAGNAFGYALLIKRLREAVEHDSEAPIALTCTTPDRFIPIPGKINVVFTMWESSSMELSAVERLSKADVVVTPTRWVGDQARKYLPPSVRVEVVNLGVDTDVWTFKDRRWPDREGRPFRFLWCAAPNPRKGWPTLNRVWADLYSAVGNVELYVKTSTPGEPRFEQNGNITFDSRRLPLEELVALYHSAHAFVYPSMGEGFGLTIAEAMACGLPCVSTSVTGHGDFVNQGNAFIIDTHPARVPATVGRESADPDGGYVMEVPIGSSLAIEMGQVLTNYSAARVKARRAARLIRARYTWEIFNRRITEVLAAVGA